MISLIAALGSNRAIGRKGKLLWHLPGDLPRFKQLTMGHPVIMGRKTYVSIGRPLPGRLNIVVTRNPDFAPGGVEICHSLEAALARAANAAPPDGEIFVIGGGELYAQAIGKADQLHLTEVDDAPPDADTFFPDYSAFTEIRTSESHTANGITYRFTRRTRPATIPPPSLPRA